MKRTSSSACSSARRGVSVAVVATLATAPVLAQAQAQSTTAQPTAELDKVVITAQKREQPAQQVGIATTVLSGDELAARGVAKVNGLQNEVPNLEIEPAFGGSQAQFRLRGVGFQDYATNNAGAVTVYVDEVAFPLPVQTQGLLFDLERVEVLRGPQGTLYGRNTTGGAVNFITRQPTKTFEGSATLGYGSYGAFDGEAVVSGPFSETLRGRLAVATQQGGGWQHNRLTGETLGDRNLTGVRGQLELDATRDLRIGLSLHAGLDKSDGQGLYSFVAQPAVPGYPVPKPALPADQDHRATGWGFDPAFLTQIGKGADAKPSRDSDSGGASLHVDWNLGSARLTSITAYDRFHRRELADYDAQELPLAETYFDSKSRNLSQELRLASNTPAAAFNWLGGLYFADEKLDENYYSSFADSFGSPVLLTSYKQTVRSASVFGQIDWRFAPDLKLIAGMRQEHERRARDDFSSRSIVPAILFTGPTSGAVSNNETSGKLGLEYQADPSVMVYGSVSRGIKSGGFTAYNTFNELALTPFAPEVLLAYEAGFKAEPTRSLRINAAAFHYDYRNQQILDAIKDPTTGATIGKIVNAPRSTIDGVELELALKPAPQLTLTNFAGWKEGHFKAYEALSPPANLAGESLYFPRLSFGVAAAYDFTIGNWALKAQADASYHDRTRSFLNRINPDYDFSVPSYWLGNARLEFAPVDARWRATLYVRNLGDTKYDLTRNFFDLPLPVAAAGPPRTLGVQVRVDF